MARPQKEGLDYFPHDTFTDDKIEAMEAKYGLAGHAFYFKLCERIYRTSNGELDLTDADTVKTIAKNFHISVRRFDEMLEYSLKKQLFDQQLFENTKRLSSNGIKKRKNNVINKRVTERQRYSESKLNDGIPATETMQKPIVSAEFLPLNKSKVNKSKVNIPPIVPQGTLPEKEESKQFKTTYGTDEFLNVSLTAGEHGKLVAKFGLQGATDWIHELSLSKASKGYKSKSDYATILAWARRREKLGTIGGNFGRSNGDQKPDTETPEQHMQRLKDSINKPF